MLFCAVYLGRTRKYQGGKLPWGMAKKTHALPYLVVVVIGKSKKSHQIYVEVNAHKFDGGEDTCVRKTHERTL